MPIFGRTNDRNLIKHFSNEVLKNILDTPVTVFKYSLNKSDTNIYGEGPDGYKTWKNGVKLYATVLTDDQEWSNSEFGMDINQKITFAFLNEHINDVQIAGAEGAFMIDPGDVVHYDSHYWEIDSTNRNQYLFGRNSNIQSSVGGTIEHGESLATVAMAHLTRRSKLNIEHPSDIRPKGESGTNEETHGLYR
tara:strand:+ start:16 stop:591 length:576 start_codon:yes stop_codon:yes gene_type:complete